MRLRSGRVLGNKNRAILDGVSADDKSNRLSCALAPLIKNIIAVYPGTSEENIVKKVQYLETLVYTILNNMEYMLQTSNWSKFIGTVPSKLKQLSGNVRDFLINSRYQFTRSQRNYLMEIVRRAEKLSITVEKKLSAKTESKNV